MNLPCNGCNTGAPFDGPYDISRQCWLCWLYHNSPEHRKLWGGDPVEMPGLLQQAINFGKAVVNHVATGMKEAAPETLAARLALCNACEHLTAERRCAHIKCGCWIDEKATWADQSCPIGKW